MNLIKISRGGRRRRGPEGGINEEDSRRSLDGGSKLGGVVKAGLEVEYPTRLGLDWRGEGVGNAEYEVIRGAEEGGDDGTADEGGEAKGDGDGLRAWTWA